MSSQRTWNRITLLVVLFALVLSICIGLISTSPAAAAENQKDSRTAQLEQQLAQVQQELELLIQTNAQLSALVEEFQAEARTEYILVLRHESAMLPGLFGDHFTVSSAVQEIRVSKAMFDSCQIGDDITTSEFHRFLASSSFSQTRIIVEDKLTR